MADVAENIVILKNDVWVTLKFSDTWVGTKMIRDPLTGRLKRVTTQDFGVVEKDGVKVAMTLSVISMKLINRLAPYLRDDSYLTRTFRIRAFGSGHQRDFEVEFP